MMNPNMMAGWGMSWAWMGLNWVLMLLFWVVLLVTAALVVRWIWPTLGRSAPRDEALETLRQRYARGEITREDFLRMEEDLRRRT